ncbi:MAG: NAD(P)H-hydrate dehydratase [Bradyrhizobium sp.]|uniref:NAD(P)H-hydrate dehydratase n=1 Tax=Bradyrhizobium sp. TaxID=376 RepID=UPI001D4806E8|nr:NAD(P)H-hydrate dehydratase [Bradyrhizobium sp.]MBV9561268.1 NAD(P)H-hydrate dehydratase [Bradyrhizobium sp.]
MEVLTTAEMERVDRLTIAAGTPGFALMLSAGQAVAEAAQHLVDEGPVLVIAGPGNNGGDGFVAAAELAAQGREVSVIQMCEREALQGDAASAARGWKYPVLPFNPHAIGRPALIIDALFGAGLSRAVEGEPRAMIEAINANGAPVLAVDLPSGVNGTTAAIMGAAVSATETVTFFRKKPAHLLLPGRLRCGRVRVVDIGIDARVLDEIRPQTFENTPQCWRESFPVPRTDGHKYSRGHVLALSGGITATGAARMSARAALRAGAGLVTLASPRDALAVNAGALTAVMVRAVDTPVELGRELADERYNAVVIGPGAGVGPRTVDFVHTALSAGRHIVLDADALTSFADAPDHLFQAVKAASPSQVVLTPHEGEFPRLFSDMSNKHPGRSKLDRVHAAAERSGAVVLLKGPDTTIVAPDGRATIAANAPPWLATAGAGDVLAGIIAGLMAQGVPAFEAASIAVWMHGEAAREAGPGLIAEDLPEVLPAVHRHIYDEFGIDY